MARIRSLKPDIWQDEAIGEISERARLIFVGLITQADDEGRMKGSPQLICSLLYPYHEIGPPEVSGALKELAGKGLIRWYEVGDRQFIELPSWNKHQKISHPTDSALPSHSEADSANPPEALQKIPEDVGWDRRGEEGSKEGIGKESAAVPASDAPLSHLLADLIAANDPNGKRPTVGQAWVTEEDRMLRLDERNPAEAERLIRWTMRHHFWRNNIRSMSKFRKQYGRLYGIAKEEGKPPRNRTDQAVDKLAAAAVRARQMEEAA